MIKKELAKPITKRYLAIMLGPDGNPDRANEIEITVKPSRHPVDYESIFFNFMDFLSFDCEFDEPLDGDDVDEWINEHPDII